MNSDTASYMTSYEMTVYDRLEGLRDFLTKSQSYVESSEIETHVKEIEKTLTFCLADLNLLIERLRKDNSELSQENLELFVENIKLQLKLEKMERDNDE